MQGIAVVLQDTITGDFIADITHLVAGGTYTDQLVGFGDATIHLAGTAEVEAGQITPAEAWALLEPNAVEIVVTSVTAAGEYTFVRYAGVVIWSEWSDESGQIDVYSEQIRTLMQHRMTFGVANFQDGDFALTGVSREVAIAEILTRATRWGGWWPLPLDLPSGGGAGSPRTCPARTRPPSRT